MSWDYLGYFASIMLVLSLMMSDLKRLRWLNLFGCTAFSSYGLVIGALPVFYTNALLALINIYHLADMGRYIERLIHSKNVKNDD